MNYMEKTMKFEIDIENSFAKAIRSHDYKVNAQALKMASSAMSQGSDIDFPKIVSENELSERLDDVIAFAPLEDYANFDIFQGGQRACNKVFEVLAAKPKEKGDDNCLIQEERWVILPDIDLYMESISGIEGNEKARSEMNISKTQYVMYHKMLEADEFDVSIALSIHKISDVLDKLSPEYVSNYMNNEDVKAIVSTLDKTIDEDIIYSELSYEVSRFVKASRLTSRQPHVLFNVMATFANATANGETEEEVLRSLLEVGMVEEKVIQKYCVALENEKAKEKAKSKASDEFEEQERVPAKTVRPLVDRVEESFLSEDEKQYFSNLLHSGMESPEDIEYINQVIDRKNVTDEELSLMDEFDKMYDDEIEGTQKKKFGFRR